MRHKFLLISLLLSITAPLAACLSPPQLNPALLLPAKDLAAPPTPAPIPIPTPIYPSAQWQWATSVETMGWDADKLATAEAYAQRMKDAGNRCELVGYDGQPHGFFNYGRGGNRMFIDTVTRMDRFLVSLGFLTGVASVEAFFGNLDQ